MAESRCAEAEIESCEVATTQIEMPRIANPHKVSVGASSCIMVAIDQQCAGGLRSLDHVGVLGIVPPRVQSRLQRPWTARLHRSAAMRGPAWCADLRKEAYRVMKSVLRSISAFIGFSALALQFWLEVGLPHGSSVIGSTFNFFSYLTILTNTIAALAMLLPLVAPGAALGRFLSRPSVRTAIAGYMVIVGATYFLF
jgi:hypothetical protein